MYILFNNIIILFYYIKYKNLKITNVKVLINSYYLIILLFYNIKYKNLKITSVKVLIKWK